MANPLLPAGRTTPIAAYIGARDTQKFNLALHISAVTATNRTDQPSAAGGQGVSSALLGGTTTLKAIGSF